MDVRPGYKQTEVGVIPEDWEVKRLGEFATIATGNTPPTADAANYGDEFLFVSPADLGETKYVTRTGKRLSQKGFAISRRFPKDSILFVCIGSTIGKCGIASVEMSSNQQINAIFPSPEFSADFLYYAVSAAAPKIRYLAGEQAVPLVNKTQFSETEVVFPPFSEQRVIATALGDVDALLVALEQLLAKKRDLKQAAMQQLLTGQTRLSGFDSDWEVKMLADVFMISAGKSKSGFVVPGGDYWVVDMGSVSIGGQLIVSKQTNFCSDFLSVGDLVMPKDDIGGGNIIGKVGYIDADKKYVLGDHVYCLRAKLGDPRFLAYMINSYPVNRSLRKKVIGSAQLGLGRRSVAEQEISFPDPAEQTAIANVLFDMDAELAALEQRLTKTRALKHGMMQELLTGRTRLV